MKPKSQNAAVKRSVKVKHTPRRSAAPPGIETALNRALRHVRGMTRDQRRQSLIDAGILTNEGKLAESYR
jgi:hypothetical protein